MPSKAENRSAEASASDAVSELLKKLSVADQRTAKGSLRVRCPIDGSTIAQVRESSPDDVGAAIGRARDAFAIWRKTPAPVRGELVRLLGEELRAGKESLARLITFETGKLPAKASAKSRR